jgi:hypothetical protein
MGLNRKNAAVEKLAEEVADGFLTHLDLLSAVERRVPFPMRLAGKGSR